MPRIGRTPLAFPFPGRAATPADWPRPDGRPPLLILDEPCAGLDPAAREHFLQFLQRLAARKNAPTLVLVTHHVEEIMPVFRHLLILKRGRAIACGPRKSALTSAMLTRAFLAPIRLQRRGARYTLRLPQKTRRLI